MRRLCVSSLFLGATSFAMQPIAPLSQRQSRASTPFAAASSRAALVDDLVDAVLPRTSAADKTSEELAKIRETVEALESLGKGYKYLKDPNLFGNYEVAFFDKSVDMAARDPTKSDATRRPKTPRSRLLGLLFRLRFSFQHVKAPNTVVNHVGFRFLGLPATVIARGEFEPLNSTAIASNRERFGTVLRDGTSVRITFGPPRVAFGPKFCPLIFELGGTAAQPPVDLCTTLCFF